jgi:hypothetical protein
MNRPALTAPQLDLNKYIDHLLWKIEHKDQQIMSLSRQCDAYVKTIKQNHQITQNLIDNVTSVLPALEPGTSFVSTKNLMDKIVNDFDTKRPINSLFPDEFIEKYMPERSKINFKNLAYTLPERGVVISEPHSIGSIIVQPEMPEYETPIDPEDLQEPPVYEMIIIFVILIFFWIIIIILLMKKP